MLHPKFHGSDQFPFWGRGKVEVKNRNMFLADCCTDQLCSSTKLPPHYPYKDARAHRPQQGPEMPTQTEISIKREPSEKYCELMEGEMLGNFERISY